MNAFMTRILLFCVPSSLRAGVEGPQAALDRLGGLRVSTSSDIPDLDLDCFEEDPKYGTRGPQEDPLHAR